jgi:hypothetical protein
VIGFLDQSMRMKKLTASRGLAMEACSYRFRRYVSSFLKDKIQDDIPITFSALAMPRRVVVHARTRAYRIRGSCDRD